MKWETHYIGGDSVSLTSATRLRRKFNLYLQRDTKTRRLTFVRLSYVVFDKAGGCKHSRMLGAFLDRTNYLERLGYGGWETWSWDIPIAWRFGWISRTNSPRWFAASWGRENESIVWRIGHIGVGHNVPKFVQRWRNAQDEREEMERAAAYDAMCKEQGWNDWYLSDEDDGRCKWSDGTPCDCGPLSKC